MKISFKAQNQSKYDFLSSNLESTLNLEYNRNEKTLANVITRTNPLGGISEFSGYPP